MTKFTFVVIVVLVFIASVSDGADDDGRTIERAINAAKAALQNLIEGVKSDKNWKLFINWAKDFTPTQIEKANDAITATKAFIQKTGITGEVYGHGNGFIEAIEGLEWNAMSNAFDAVLTALPKRAPIPDAPTNPAATPAPKNGGDDKKDNPSSVVSQSAPSMMIAAFVVIAFLMN